MKKNVINEKIDFVITWVDGTDEKWLAEKNQYLGIKGDSNINRFRDCQNLQYLFRGIENFAPWVNKIFFVTWGHLPDWLDVNNPKLEIVKHEDFIPKEYLPTFNSNVIEMNLFRIKNLSSKFVVFNDDLFVLKNLKQEDFFENGLPKDMYIEYIKKNCSRRHAILRKNYSDIINKYFVKKDVVKKCKGKVFNYKYGINNFRNFKMQKYEEFQDIYSQHLTQCYLKETFETVWKNEPEKLDIACKNKFRADTDLGCVLCRYWQLFTGQFIPTSKIGKYFCMSNNNSKLIKAIRKRKYKVICINDASINIDFEKARDEINNELNLIFPNKCSFEI